MKLEKFAGLVGKEMSVLELSNELQQLGCEDIGYFGNLKDLLEDGNMVVATDDQGEEHIQIYYDVTVMADENEEVTEASIVKITQIDEF
jgi:hypothetical protein